MSYLALARKYRPRTFREMVGQEHVVQALTHALQTQRLHHAYLFTGTRGVGKTTVARILAKSLDCTGVDGKGGITAEPCGVCQTCRDIDAGRCVDYVELDAASNRGVDEISQLLEQAVYKPVIGRFKIFMIDEVHMLSNTAFNAMLKTLEEPPEYVKFVLATTDPQKVPVTVLSRCLQFNLRPMAPQTVFEHLQHVLGAEQVPAEPGALRLIARAARGSMRDALSLTDQAIAFGSGSVAEADVRRMLGTVDRSHVFDLVEALAAGNGRTVVEITERMRAAGLSADAALDEMATVLQHVAVLQVAPDAADATDPDEVRMRALAGRLPADLLQLLYSIVLRGRGELGLASDEYAALTMVLLRLLAFVPAGAPAGAHTRDDGAAGSAAKAAALQASDQVVPTVAAPTRTPPAAAAGNSVTPLAAAPMAAATATGGAGHGRGAPAVSNETAGHAAADGTRAAGVGSPGARPGVEPPAAAATADRAGNRPDAPAAAVETEPTAGRTTTAGSESARVGGVPAPVAAAAPPESAACTSLAAVLAGPAGTPAPHIEVPRAAAGRAEQDAPAAVKPPRAEPPAPVAPANPVAGAAPRADSVAANAASSGTPPDRSYPRAHTPPDEAAFPAIAVQEARASRTPADMALPPWVDEDIPEDDAPAPAAPATPPAEAPLPEDAAAPRQRPRPSPTAADPADPVDTFAAPRREPLPDLPPATALTDRWAEVVGRLVEEDRVQALARELALNTELTALDAGENTWSLVCARETLAQENTRNKLAAALQKLLGHPATLDLRCGPTADTPGRRRARAQARRQAQAEATVARDPDVQVWLRQFPGAAIVPGSVHPL